MSYPYRTPAPPAPVRWGSAWGRFIVRLQRRLGSGEAHRRWLVRKYRGAEWQHLTEVRYNVARSCIVCGGIDPLSKHSKQAAEDGLQVGHTATCHLDLARVDRRG
jgi:hypothetical protein